MYITKPGFYEEVLYIDYKSMYTHLLKGDFPIGIPVYSENVSDIQTKGFYYVTLKSYDLWNSLPTRLEKNTTYITGIFSGFYW